MKKLYLSIAFVLLCLPALAQTYCFQVSTIAAMQRFAEECRTRDRLEG
jgi:hypothetical protein